MSQVPPTPILSSKPGGAAVTEILDADAWNSEMALVVLRDREAARKIRAHDEALRSALSEAERERDAAWAAVRAHEGFIDRADAAERALSETIDALRELLDASDAVTNSLPGEAYGELERYSTAKNRARALLVSLEAKEATDAT